MYGGNTLLAHEVGAGKTFEMVAAAMEMQNSQKREQDSTAQTLSSMGR